MSLEANKIAAAVLTAGVVAMTSGFIASLLFPSHHGGEEAHEQAFTIAEVETGHAEGGEATPMLSILALMGAADVANGEVVANRKCVSCHSFEEGGPDKVGPNLWSVLGRDPGSHAGFAYSDALTGLEISAWSYEELDAFLTSPRNFAPGTKMSFGGISRPEERADVIAYLRSLSASPLPIPEAPAMEPAMPEMEEDSSMTMPATDAVAATTEMAMAEGGSVLEMIAGADLAVGEAAFRRKCTSCHTTEEGGANKVGPNLWNVVGHDIAIHPDFSYSDALEAVEGNWTFEQLDAWLARPRDFASGTKMSFAGLRDEGERAAVIAYLRSLSASPVPLE